MPQLDPVPFASIYLSFSTVFFTSYFLFLRFFLPRISLMVKTQIKYYMHTIQQLFIYQYLMTRKDPHPNEVSVKSANFICAIQLVFQNINLLVVQFIDLISASCYERGSVYLVQQCFFFKKKQSLFI
uniref:ATP synthase F0 subunit 8 n=1 Tax=Eukaryota sp. BB2 TaxID=1949062 RepID=A0A1X8VEX9_9EUKA|nr:ATP synthase F0 subunit 8 [Eukaryota sp. BB2]AQL10464.1 ATP synthase F0 subunit 8 [Eukaryota sp. BB2]